MSRQTIIEKQLLRLINATRNKKITLSEIQHPSDRSLQYKLTEERARQHIQNFRAGFVTRQTKYAPRRQSVGFSSIKEYDAFEALLGAVKENRIESATSPYPYIRYLAKLVKENLVKEKDIHYFHSDEEILILRDPR